MESGNYSQSVIFEFGNNQQFLFSISDKFALSISCQVIPRGFMRKYAHRASVCPISRAEPADVHAAGKGMTSQKIWV
jgi:hypothetical protein